MVNSMVRCTGSWLCRFFPPQQWRGREGADMTGLDGRHAKSRDSALSAELTHSFAAHSIPDEHARRGLWGFLLTTVRGKQP